MINLFSRKKEVNQQDQQSVINVIENQILNEINEKLKQFYNKIEILRKLNINEMSKLDEKTAFNNNIEELSNLTDAISILLEILDLLKTYIRNYSEEIKANQYIDPTTKMNALAIIRDKIGKVKNRVDNLFLELEIILNNLSRL